jgi:hypothetical protein
MNGIPTQSPSPRARVASAAISERLWRSSAIPASPHRIEPHHHQRASCRVLEGGEKYPTDNGDNRCAAMRATVSELYPGLL